MQWLTSAGSVIRWGRTSELDGSWAVNASGSSAAPAHIRVAARQFSLNGTTYCLKGNGAHTVFTWGDGTTVQSIERWVQGGGGEVSEVHWYTNKTGQQSIRWDRV